MIDIKKNIRLADFTTFRIGGEAKYFCEVGNAEQLSEALRHAIRNSLKFCLLGGGSNVFFDDDGFDGIVIKLGSGKDGIEKSTDGKIRCWAGENLASLVEFGKQNALSGAENLAGIPGSIGGAIRGNAGAFGSEMGDLIESVDFVEINNGEISRQTKNAKECQFGYRNSLFKENQNIIIMSAVIIMQAGNATEIGKRINDIIEMRKEKQPIGWTGTAGSYFKNPVVSNPTIISRFEKEAGSKSREGRISAGWLISDAGLAGMAIGGAESPEKNANFIINKGGAKAQDVVILASLIKQKVRMELSVELYEEVQFISK